VEFKFDFETPMHCSSNMSIYTVVILILRYWL